MVSCPACNKEVNEDFGMVTCPHCKAVFMIDYGGKVQYGTAESEEDLSSFEQEEDFEEEDSDFDEPEDSSENTFNDFDENDSEANGFSDTQDEEPLDYQQPNSFYDNNDTEEEDFGDASDFEEPVGEEDNSVDDFENEEPSAEDFEEEESAENYNSGFVSEFDSEQDEDSGDYSDEIAAPPIAPPLAADTKPVDITDFANSEESSLDGGEFRYTIKVSRIDSKDLRDSLKYVLMDEKLKLNHNEYLKNIVDGSVTIPDLHPIKAKRIVEQLQFFDLDVQWEQKRVIIEEPVVDEAAGEGDFIEE